MQAINKNLFTELDVDTLARYLLSESKYLAYDNELTIELDKEELDVDIIARLENLKDKAFKQAQMCARDLGFTPTSRLKLVIPTKEDDDDYEL